MKLLHFFILALTFASCDNKKMIYIRFESGLNHDRTILTYDDRIVYDSILTTDGSTDVAGRFAFEGKLNKNLLVNIGGKYSDKMLVTDSLRKLSVSIYRDSIYVKKMIKTIRY